MKKTHTTTKQGSELAINHVPKIEKSSDYKMFHPNTEQKPMKPKHISGLAASMKKYGFLASKPVHVYRVGERYRIVDGHHRLAAAETLRIPFYYVVESTESQAAIAEVNSNVVKWANFDFVRMFASRGKPDYIELRAYCEKGIPVGMAASMLIGNAASSGNANQQIQNGTFKIKERGQIDELVNLLDALGKKSLVVKSRNFISAFSLCYMASEIDTDKLKHRICENPMMLDKTSNLDQMLAQMEDIYNFRSREKTPLSFIVRKEAAERSVVNITK